MKRTLAIALLLLGSRLLPTGAIANEIKVSSFNVHFENTHIAETLALVTDFDPDVILFQESTPKLAQGVKTHLPATYAHGWFTEAGKHPAGGFGVVSKFPIVRQRFITWTKGAFGTQTFSIKQGAETIRFVNLHLNPAAMPDEHNFATALHAMMMNNKIHAFELGEILADYDEQQPTIIAGDLNSFSNFAASKIITRKGFADAHLSLDENADAVSTWRRSGDGPAVICRFDYIFHNPWFKATALEVVENNYSDHALLNCTLELKPKAE